MITHDLETIKEVLDRFIILKQSIIFQGTFKQAQQSTHKDVQDFFSHPH
jgi:phospholipid/cholesterol/gamma-HCH transport system ATP-binding protein